MQRTLLGTLSLLLIAAGAALLWFGGKDAATQQYAAGCLRGGVLIAVLWLALPQARTPANLLGLVVVLVLAVVLVARPRLLIVLLSPPVLGVLLAIGGVLTVLRRMAPRRTSTPRKRRPPGQPGASR